MASIDAVMERARGLSGSELGLAATGAAAAAFVSALIAQAFGWDPCPLCIWQRYPYVIGAAFAAPALLLALGPKLRAALFALAGAIFLVGVGLAIFHSGVEFGWWEGLASCSAPDLSRSFEAVMGGTPTPRCDERIPFFLGLTMANWNVFVSLGVAGVFAVAAQRTAAGA